MFSVEDENEMKAWLFDNIVITENNFRMYFAIVEIKLKRMKKLKGRMILKIQGQHFTFQIEEVSSSVFHRKRSLATQTLT